MVASADDIVVKNSDGVAIYYNYINDGAELAVTYRGSSAAYYSYEYSGNVVIPEEVTYENRILKVTSIGDQAFSLCSGLTSVTIPNSVTSIGYRAFYYCKGLTSVTIGNSVTSIGGAAFAHCTGLTSVTIGNSVTSIGESAFSGCSGLTSVTIGNSVTSIGDWAFANCSGLTSVTIGNSVTSIGRSAFSGCSRLTSVTIPNSVTSIGEWAFAHCTGLTSVTIPNSVTSIGNYAFYNCSGLTSVTIGNSVTSIGYNAFAFCTNLTDFYCYAEGVPTANSYAFGDSPVKKVTLHVPAGAVNAYKAATPWSDFKEIVALTNDDPQPTEIDKIVVTDSNKGVFYHLNGRRVDNPSKGLYIKNGKKYVVK